MVVDEGESSQVIVSTFCMYQPMMIHVKLPHNYVNG